MPLISHSIFRRFMNPFLKLFFSKSIPAGAQTTVQVAVDPKLQNVTGKYFRECRVAETSPATKDRYVSLWLWRKSEQLTGIKFSKKNLFPN